ncbi:MAG: AAA family ATPase [Candidatus Omnitrophica bacterium]|nr:AAA family ATPase [Candidatus Omnitrophota bacterium]
MSYIEDAYKTLGTRGDSKGNYFNEGEIEKTGSPKYRKKDSVFKVPLPKTARELGAIRREERLLEETAPSTGFEELDRLVSGFVPKHLITLTGQTNSGKTTLAINFAYSVVRQPGCKVLYLALEPDTAIIELLTALRTQKKIYRPKAGKDYNQEMTTEKDLVADIPNLDFYTDEIMTIEELVKITEERLKDKKYDLIIVDHIGYFVQGSKESYLQAQADLLKKLARFTKDHSTCVMAIAHLNKQAKTQKITMDNISGSAAFKQDSTDVYIITKDEPVRNKQGRLMQSNTGKFYVAKSKTAGGWGDFNINFLNNGLILDDYGLAKYSREGVN